MYFRNLHNFLEILNWKNEFWEKIKLGPYGLGSRILQFSLKIQIVLYLDQAQTVRARQGVARWSSSLKYSHVRASTEKCVNTF
jgi:hypothetical protein